MAYITSLICLANSYRSGGHCVAGKEFLSHCFGPWIRPISIRIGHELSNAECHYADRSTPHLLDIMRIGLLHPNPSGHQTENVSLDASYKWLRIGSFDDAALPALCDNPASLWTLSDSTSGGRFNCILPAEAAAHRDSLYLIYVEDLTIRVGRDRPDYARPYHASFTYKQIEYILRVTDPAVLSAFMVHAEGNYPVGKAYLCVSLAHVFAANNRCHKLVAGIITNPRL